MTPPAPTAPTAPTAPGAGSSWIVYAVVLLALAAVGTVQLVRSRLRSRGLCGPASFRESALILLTLLALTATVAGLLADAATEGDGLTVIDAPIWAWMVEHRTVILTAMFLAVTAVGSTAGMAVLALIVVGALLRRRARRGDAALVAVVAAGASVLIAVVKPIVGRARPPEQYRLVTETSLSFPSGHATASIAIIGVITVVLLSRVRSGRNRSVTVVLAAILVATIGVSRIYLGAHWSTDVLGGWATGGAWLLACLAVRALVHRHLALVTTGRDRIHALHLPHFPAGGRTSAGTDEGKQQ